MAKAAAGSEKNIVPKRLIAIHDDNEWARAIDAALGDAAQPPQPGADPFSLGDSELTGRTLEFAGFEKVRFEDVREPVFYGHDLDAALAVVRGFRTRAGPSRA